MSERIYTGIGSRDVPEPYKTRLSNIAKVLYKLNFTLRSGAADGSDTIFERNHFSKKKEIFLPWKGFNNSKSNLYEQPKEASEIAEKYHPVYNKLTDPQKKLMDRNVLQILGKDLKTKSDFVVCYTSDECNSKATRTNKTGGTGQAIAIASDNNIPIYNIANEDDYKKLINYLKDVKKGKISFNKKEKKIAGRECKFIHHIPAKVDVRDDLHVVKEVIHYEDGDKKKNLRLIKNFERPFWITKAFYQNHNDKKESEYIDRLNKFHATQSELPSKIASRLGNQFVGVRDMRTILSSPYVYGTDVGSKAILKHQYDKKYPGFTSPYEVATFDIENDIASGEITVFSIAMKDKIYTAFTKKFIDKEIDVNNRLKRLYDKYIPKTKMLEDIDIEYEVVDDDLEAITKVFDKAHEWQPDFLTAWNMSYDIKVILDTLEGYNVDPKNVFSDPRLPNNYKYFKFKEAPDQKKTESGKIHPVSPNEQWHVIEAPASFYIIDAMATHHFIRVGSKSVPGGYTLDNILKQELGDKLGKLKFPNDEDAPPSNSPDWHIYMSRYKKLEYIIYNQWDILSMLELDEKTKDLSYVLPMLSGISSYDIFNSGPKKIIDAMHYFYLENGRVLGTKQVNNDNDKLLGLDSWIVTLSSSRIKENGMQIIEENGFLRTNVRGHTYDAD